VLSQSGRTRSGFSKGTLGRMVISYFMEPTKCPHHGRYLLRELQLERFS